MRQLRAMASSVILTLALTGCGGPRWQVHSVENSYSDPSSPEDDFTSGDVILLDTRGGQTWILSWDDDGYRWEPISRDE
jgi:hypothetical protein